MDDLFAPRPDTGTGDTRIHVGIGGWTYAPWRGGVFYPDKLVQRRELEYAGRSLRSTGYGTVVFGIGRDQDGPASVTVVRPDGRREQARVVSARQRDDDRTDFARPFSWPVQGRISGRFGNQRVYNGKPGSPHSGMDIAAPNGTPVKAPAAGVVTFAAPDLYLTGGTVLLDHGFGISSNFLHLSRIDVKVGDRIEQGQVIAAVGSTGRSTGPHLHWGMNWFDTRIDPLLVLERTP